MIPQERSCDCECIDGYDGQLEAGMVLTAESFVGPRRGGEGVKLENQVLVTNDGPELLTTSSLSLTP